MEDVEVEESDVAVLLELPKQQRIGIAKITTSTNQVKELVFFGGWVIYTGAALKTLPQLGQVGAVFEQRF